MEFEFFVLYFTSPHLTSPHLTSPHINSPHFVTCSQACFDFIHYIHSVFLNIFRSPGIFFGLYCSFCCGTNFFCLRIFCFVLIFFFPIFSNVVIFNSFMVYCSFLCVFYVFLYIVPNLKIQTSNGVTELLYAHTSPQYDMRLNP